MIALGVVIVVLLVIASALFVVPVLRHDNRVQGTSRDSLNKAFYHHRLSELEKDEQQGVVAGRSQFIQELQENLLTDIPTQQASASQPIGRWTLIPGVLLLVVISVGFYLYAGGLAQVIKWQQVVDRMPALLKNLNDEHAQQLNITDVQDLGLGLRTELQQDPLNVKKWEMLGRVGIALNNSSTATQAFAKTYELEPNNMDVKLGYADVLTRSNNPQDNVIGGDILKSMLQNKQGDLRVLSLLAYNESEQGHYAQAIGAWQTILKILPVGDSRAEMVKANIEQAKAKSGQDVAKLNVNVTLSVLAAKQLPQQGMVFISVTDGSNPVPVAVKKLPLSRFPLSVTVDDTNAMMPERLLSSLHQLKVHVRISQNGLANPVSGDWFGDSPLIDFSSNGQVNIEINKQIP